MDLSEFKVKELLESTGQSDALSDREKHLLGLAVVLTRGCTACTGGRLEKAREFGIEPETIRAAIDLVAAVNAGVTVRTAIEGATKNNVEMACSDNQCSTGVPS